MTKKKFDLGNPALHFIGVPKEENGREEGESATPSKAAAPEGYKVNPLYIEKKNRRLQLLLQPSLYDKLKERAGKEESSINELIHSILEKAVKGE